MILVGLGGLRWTDLSAAGTPAIWRLALAGSVGSLVTTTVNSATCPVDGWLTLSTGFRAAGELAAGPCPGLPPVRSGIGQTGPGPARIPALPARLIPLNTTKLSYLPYWRNVLASASPDCATAIGPGAGLALASASGRVERYLPGAGSMTNFKALGLIFRQCRLTVIDLGALPATGSARTRAVAAADLAVRTIAVAAPAGSALALAGLADDGSPRLRVLIVSGPGYRAGLLTATSTRQPGVITITDLTPSIYRWLRGRPVPARAGLPGTCLGSAGRGSLAGVVAAMIRQDTADQVYRSTAGWFFLGYGAAGSVLLALVLIAWRGAGERRTRRRAAACTVVGVGFGAVPAGSFLAMTIPWPGLAHPAVLLYLLTLAWAAVIAAVALTGPWRRSVFGPPGLVAAVTLTLIAADVIAGSRLQIGAPFGLSLTEGGRFYGIGNNAIGGYACAALFTAAWAAAAAGRRRPAVLAAGGVAAAAVIAAGWPGFGAKVGGTIAMVPAFLLLLAAIGGIRITPRLGIAIALSGVVLAGAFAAINYLDPALTGSSHLGSFFGQLIGGGSGARATLHRKITSNLNSLTLAWFAPVVPVAMLVTGLMLAFPAWLGVRALAVAQERSVLIRATLRSVWLVLMLAWLADDSGVSVTAAGFAVALPLSIAAVIRAASQPAVSSPPSPPSPVQVGQDRHGAGTKSTPD